MQSLGEVERIGQGAEQLGVRDLLDLLVVLLLLARHAVQIVVGRVAGESRLAGRARLDHLLLVALAQGKFIAAVQHEGR